MHEDEKMADLFGQPEIASILSSLTPRRHRQGFCVWFTGLSGSGKSSIAEDLLKLLSAREQQVILLDGDVVRTHISKGLGFSREDRDTNVRRIGIVASEIVRQSGVVICAAVSPYNSTREECRDLVGKDRFILVYVSTPLEICEQRDRKGLYAKARRGEIKNFTGIDDPYEPPVSPNILLSTTECSPKDNAIEIIDYLEKNRLLEV